MFRLLAEKVAHLLYVTPRNPTGHYKVNLMNPIQRLLLTKLVEVSTDEREKRRHDDDGDGKIDAVRSVLHTRKSISFNAVRGTDIHDVLECR